MKNTNEIQGWFTYPQTFNFLLQSIPPNGKFAECGAWLGQSSSYLCDVASSMRPDVTIYIVDSWKGSSAEVATSHKLATTTDIYDIFLENMGSRKFTSIRALSVDACKQFDDESLDVVFIDMGHEYHEVKEDITVWYPKVKSNGYIAGHDFSFEGVSRAVHEQLGHLNILNGQGDCWIVKKEVTT